MARSTTSAPAVGIIMGCQSDWETMSHAADTLRLLGVTFETEVVSAHRTPLKLKDYSLAAKRRGLKDAALARRLDAYRAKQTKAVLDNPVPGRKGKRR